MDGVYVEAITSGKNKSTVLESLRDRLVGRVLAEEIVDTEGKVLYHVNDYITEDMADVIADLREKHGDGRVKIRSVLTCKSHYAYAGPATAVTCYCQKGGSGRSRWYHCRPGNR